MGTVLSKVQDAETFTDDVEETVVVIVVVGYVDATKQISNKIVIKTILLFLLNTI
jgi:hypothetical protein